MKQNLLVNSTHNLAMFASLTHTVHQPPSGISEDYQYQHLNRMTTLKEIKKQVC